MRSRLAVLTLALLATLGTGVVPEPGASAGTETAKAAQLTIRVLSGRADLVSGGSALLAINVSKANLPKLKVTVGSTNVTRRFAMRQDGHVEGLLTGLAVGDNVVKAILPSGRGATITLTDHPNGGPILSGPQLTTWVCEKGAVDAQCNKPSTYVFEYMSTDSSKSGFQPYDTKNPPTDVKMTTTGNGVTVPFIVRVETGYMDRDQYQLTALYQPGKPWTAVAPQPQFDHKLLITHGSSCGDDRTTGTAPATTGDAAGDYALGKGFVVMSTALDNSGHNCNIAVQAESLIMAKQHLVTSYGTLRYTIGTGCSGGSLAEQWIANAYPGIYQGILPTCSFPDAYSTATQFLDYHLLLQYFTNPSKWDVASGVAWSPTQMGDVLGGPDGVQNAEVSEQAQFHVAVPTDACAGTTAANRYDPAKNPGGVRCTIEDAAVNVFGPEEQKFWDAQEQQVGHGFVRLPVDNVGVQYGLQPLLAGTITAADFVDLNVKAGGVDIDTNPLPTRLDNGDSASLGRAYKTGMIDEANNLDQIPIIDCRGTNPGLFHDTYRAFAIRARLDREHGSHANQLIWEGPVPLMADKNCELNSFKAINRWLRTMEKDTRSMPLAQKVVADKPADLTDRCYDGAGAKVSDGLCPAAVVSVEATPRMVAGDAISTDANKCQLKPLSMTDYPGVTFTAAQWAQLQTLYSSGVCDFSKPGVSQQDTVGWLTYQDRDGNVVYGGTPLGPAPASTPLAPTP